MALTRKFLKAMGIEDEKIDQIIDAHTETVTALKEERDALKADAEALPGVKKELDALKKAAEAGQQDAYKEKYDALKKEYDQYKADIEAKTETDAKARLYREIAKKAGVTEKRLDAILKVTDIKALKLAKDGQTLEDADKLEAAIKTEWADFIPGTETHGAGAATPPTGAGSGAPDLGKLSMADYIAARSKKK